MKSLTIGFNNAENVGDRYLLSESDFTLSNSRDKS